MIINLLDNSLKYAIDTPEILITIYEEDNKIKLSVIDNGPGIPAEYLNKVFEKFFRVPSGDRHDIKGYGLGLSYSYKIMQQHKGSITVENLKDAGCKFTLSFPKYV
ncbi:MAG TPA: ATP-binding protein [Saprospiraceae bacterium]|nr:ATP-binding protein [Saprospiraceae bacterium]